MSIQQIKITKPNWLIELCTDIPSTAKIAEYNDGIAILDSWPNSRCKKLIQSFSDKYSLIIADPPYGNIVDKYWDRFEQAVDLVKLQIKQCYWLQDISYEGSALYWFGGYGKPGFRPYYQWSIDVERYTDWRIAMPITWRKKRAYGVKHNYLSTREELAYCVLGDIKRPRLFNIPLLNEKRGYDGYNALYPAKSEYKRRSAVWIDIEPSLKEIWESIQLEVEDTQTDIWANITEILRGKLHTCHKPGDLVAIPIRIHTKESEPVLDLFAGSGEVSVQCRKLNRKFVAVERDEIEWKKIIKRLGSPNKIVLVQK